jgi:hypothetical protein
MPGRADAALLQLSPKQHGEGKVPDRSRGLTYIEGAARGPLTSVPRRELMTKRRSEPGAALDRLDERLTERGRARTAETVGGRPAEIDNY